MVDSFTEEASVEDWDRLTALPGRIVLKRLNVQPDSGLVIIGRERMASSDNLGYARVVSVGPSDPEFPALDISAGAVVMYRQHQMQSEVFHLSKDKRFVVCHQRWVVGEVEVKDDE